MLFLLSFFDYTLPLPYTFSLAFSPNRPVGLTMSIIMSRAKVKASEKVVQPKALYYVFADTDYKRAYHRAGYAADAAEHRRHEGLQAGHARRRWVLRAA